MMLNVDGLPLAATILLLLPLLYFFLTTPTFLLRPLSDPVVATLLRGLFSLHFRLVAGAATLAVIAFLVADQPAYGGAVAVIAALALTARAWFLRRLDAAIRARESGDALAPARLRRLHWGGMVFNAAQLLAVMAAIPRVFERMG